VVEAVRPHRGDGRGEAWRLLVANHQLIEDWLRTDELTVRKVHDLLGRRGVVVPERTLHRYALEVCDVGRGGRGTTVRVADGEPGDECQIDFGKLGLIPDPAVGRHRVCHALIFTPVVSRYSFVWLSFRQRIEDVIAGCEAAWVFYDGVFATVIPDNLKAIVDRSDSLAPRLNQAFVEYAQSRGFVIDPARVRSPQDKPRVERVVPFVRQSFFAGEDFVDLTDAQRRVEAWCRERAGMRVHGTIQARPAEVFGIEEQARLRPSPTAPYDVPIYTTAKVHRDHHIEVAKALYSVPGNLIGQRVEVRADRSLVRVFARGQLVKVHPRQQPGGRSTDPDDLPSERTAYAMRDLDHLRRLATGMAQPSARTPPRCWTRHCRGPGCVRSTRCWVWSRSEAPSGSRRRAPALWSTKPSTLGSSAACSNAAPRTRRGSRRCPAWSWRPGSPVTPSTSPPAPTAVRDDHTDRHARAPRAAAPGQARPLFRHAPRTPGARADRRHGTRRVPRARPRR
jgi:transposase